MQQSAVSHAWVQSSLRKEIVGNVCGLGERLGQVYAGFVANRVVGREGSMSWRCEFVGNSETG